MPLNGLCRQAQAANATYHFNIDGVTRVYHKLGSSTSIVVTPVDCRHVCLKGDNVRIDSCVAAANPWDALQRPGQRGVCIADDPRRSVKSKQRE